jgi:hypothetical protein
VTKKNTPEQAAISKARELARHRKWKAANKSLIKSYRRQYYLDHKQEEINSELARRAKMTPKQRGDLTRRYHELHPEYAQTVRLRRYNLTITDYNKMVDAQGGVCLICKNPPSKRGRATNSLVVDHDHGCCPGQKSCGKCVRGLLCHTCNLILGILETNHQLVDRMNEYIIAGGSRGTRFIEEQVEECAGL